MITFERTDPAPEAPGRRVDLDADPESFAAWLRERGHLDLSEEDANVYEAWLRQRTGGPQPVNATRQPLPPGQSTVDPYTARGFSVDGSFALMPDRAGVVDLFEAVRERRPLRVEVPSTVDFATITTTQSGRNTDYLRRGVMPMPLRIADLVGLPSEDVGWGGSSAFPKMGTAAAPGGTAEGAAKVEYAAVTAGSATPSTLATWTDVTGQVRSLAGFEDRLRNKLARQIALGENEVLRAAAATGATAQGFVAGDQSLQILRAAATIEATVGVRPDLMLFNPADTALLFGTGVSNAFPSELRELSMRMFGMQALALSSQPAGFALCGAWAASSTLVVGQRLTYMVDPFTQMKSNIVTVLAEEAVALAVHEVAGFTSVDIITP